MPSGEKGKPAFRLTPASGSSIDLYPGKGYLVGRAFMAPATLPEALKDKKWIRVSEGTVSALHATVVLSDDGIVVTDLDSANGCRLNGERLREFTARDADTVGFGRVSFSLVRVTGDQVSPDGPAGQPPNPPKNARAPSGPGATKPSGDSTRDPQGATGQGATKPFGEASRDARAASRPGDTNPIAEVNKTTSGLTMVRASLELLADPRAAKLTLLLEVAKDLSRPLAVDELLERVCDRMLTLTNVDRVALVTVEGDALELQTKIAATRRGPEPDFVLPRSLAYTVISDLEPMRVDRGQGTTVVRDESLMVRGVWSAMCVPLLDERGGLLGLLYVDSMVPGRSFTDDDLDFLRSFGGIVTTALRSSELVQALQREASALGRLRARLGPNLGDEFFADGLVLRGGEPREVVVVEARLLGVERLDGSAEAGPLRTALAEFFGAMSQVVFDYGGTLDRLQGNRLVGDWGATSIRADNPDRAFAAARDMQRTWSGDDDAPRHGLAIGIGMAGGTALSHSVMVDGRSWLTLVGEPVTTATRLALRAGKGEILIASSLHARMTSPPAGARALFARPPAIRVRRA